MFGRKGGATGGGRAQVAPMDEINLHFTGDFHAITAAHNLLAAMIDNHILLGQRARNRSAPHRLAARPGRERPRAARRSSRLGGLANGFPREDGFDITVASEVMAMFCLRATIDDLEARLGRMIVAYTRDKKPVTARPASRRRRR